MLTMLFWTVFLVVAHAGRIRGAVTAVAVAKNERRDIFMTSPWLSVYTVCFLSATLSRALYPCLGHIACRLGPVSYKRGEAGGVAGQPAPKNGGEEPFLTAVRFSSF
jgi:hypothetical protein